jgi:hypothetical protein
VGHLIELSDREGQGVATAVKEGGGDEVLGSLNPRADLLALAPRTQGHYIEFSRSGIREG